MEVAGKYGVMLTDPASNSQQGDVSAAAARFRCVVSTPFGTPVVPDVYSCSTTSCGPAGTPGSTGSCAASSCSYSSPTTTVPCSAYSGPAIANEGCASCSTAFSSGRASRQLTGTATAPSLAAAKSSSITSGAVRSTYATREPDPTPCARSACASRLERSSSCA